MTGAMSLCGFGIFDKIVAVPGFLPQLAGYVCRNPENWITFAATNHHSKMKDNNNDSTMVLARFGRDKRRRTVTATAERVERRPRPQRDAADSERTARPERASYNPNFTRDNRPAFDQPRRKPYGEKSRRSFGEKPDYDNRRFDNDQTTFGEERPSYGAHRTPRRYNDKPAFQSGDDRKNASGKFGAKAYGDKRGKRNFGDNPEYPSHDHKTDFKKSGPKNYGNKKFADKKSGRGFGSKPASYPKYDPAKQTGEMRLNRFLAQSGICSRREADDFITAGLVSVNGRIVTELGTKVLPTDEVKFNDSRVEGEKKVYLVLNKPKGYVTSLDDPHATKTVMELVAGACEERVYPVGRLDKNSLGLLLFTNDGDLTKQLTHPSYRKKKIYQVTLDKPLTRADMDRIAEGVTLEDGEIFADEISYVKENKQEIGIEIHSGRNRIVRRIFEFLGYTVTKLDRVYYAGLTKKNLKRGAWRFLTREEVERLKSGRYE